MTVLLLLLALLGGSAMHAAHALPTPHAAEVEAATIAVGTAFESRTTVGALVDHLGLDYSPRVPDAPVYVAPAAPAAHPGYVGLLCPAYSEWHWLCQAMPTPYLTFYSGNLTTDAEWVMAIAHEEFHWRFPQLSEARAWTYGCNVSWVERWCGAGAFRGGAR